MATQKQKRRDRSAIESKILLTACYQVARSACTAPVCNVIWKWMRITYHGMDSNARYQQPNFLWTFIPIYVCVPSLDMLFLSLCSFSFIFRVPVHLFHLIPNSVSHLLLLFFHFTLDAFFYLVYSIVLCFFVSRPVPRQTCAWMCGFQPVSVAFLRDRIRTFHAECQVIET